jgi:hypothetical protein
MLHNSAVESLETYPERLTAVITKLLTQECENFCKLDISVMFKKCVEISNNMFSICHSRVLCIDG